MRASARCPGSKTGRARRAANDDRQSVGQILQALQQRPSRTPYLDRLLLSVAWTVVTVALAWAFCPTCIARTRLAPRRHPRCSASPWCSALPIVFFYRDRPYGGARAASCA